jgi:hypothetical protein
MTQVEKLWAVVEAVEWKRRLEIHGFTCELGECEYDGQDWAELIMKADERLDAALAALDPGEARTEGR